MHVLLTGGLTATVENALKVQEVARRAEGSAVLQRTFRGRWREVDATDTQAPAHGTQHLSCWCPGRLSLHPHKYPHGCHGYHLYTLLKQGRPTW